MCSFWLYAVIFVMLMNEGQLNGFEYRIFIKAYVDG